MSRLQDLEKLAENHDSTDEQVSRLAMRLVYDAMRPYVGSGAKELTGKDADDLLAGMAEVIAVLVRANRFAAAGAICLHLHTALGPTPPCSAASCAADPTGRTACPTDENGAPDCAGCLSAAEQDDDATDLVQISTKRNRSRKD